MARTRTAGTSRLLASRQRFAAARCRSDEQRLATRTKGAVWLLASALAIAGCGGDDSGDGQGTAGDTAGGGAGDDGSSGSQAGNAGRDPGGSGSGGSGRSGNGGNSGGSGSGGSNGSSGSGSGGDDGGDDGGTDPTPTTCKAPVPATEFGNDCPDGDPVALELELVAGDLDVPVFVTAPPGDESRLFVLERSGRIVILDRESGDEISEFLNLPDVATSDSLNDERGLLGLAFHPDYPDDPRFFVYYSAMPNTGLEQTLSAFEVSSSDPDAADPDSEQVLQSFDDPAGNHNGGMLAFGPDGCLYVGSGDGGSSDDMGGGHAPEGNGQNLDTPLGKMLRFDVDDPDNGAPGNLQGAGIPHIWDYGLRNPWRFSFDRQTHDLYIGDVGQGAWEEVDVSPAGVGNKNWGWRVAEGNHCRPGAGGDPGCDLSEFEAAVDEYPHGGGDDCVVGGYVYRGSAIPSLQGWYVYGDNGPGRRIRTFVWDGEGRCGDNTIVLSDRDDINLDADITSFGEDGSGELYLTTSTSVYRFVAQ
jgi:glucose/arabinose dehydrogenase